MADNFPVTPGSGRNVASDQVTYSGDTADIQLIRPVLVSGSEGSKSVVGLTGDDTYGLDVDVTRVTGTVAVSGPLTNTELRAVAVPVSLATVPSHAVTNSGTFAVQVSNTATVTGAGGTFPVTDSGGSLTVDAPVGTPVFVRLSDGTTAIGTLPVSLASLPALAVGSNIIGRVGIDQSNPGTTNAVAISASEFHIGAVGGAKVAVTGNFNRPNDTTSYGAGDAVSNSTSSTTLITFSNFARISGGSGYIVGARMSTNKKSIIPRFRVHLFNTTGATLSVDNAPYQTKYADFSKRIGFFDLPALQTAADGTNSDESRTSDLTLRIPFVTSGSRDIYAALEVLDTFAPDSGQSFSIQLLGDVD